MTTTYTAAIATASDVVAGDYCDITVNENEIIGYRQDDEGNDIPDYSASGPQVMEAVETDVRTDDDDKLAKVDAAAEKILNDHGWSVVVGTWEVASDALYVTVEPSGDSDLHTHAVARATAKLAFDTTTAILRADVLRAAAEGHAETEIARRAGIDRMTVRAWIGK